ncbi:dimethylallyl tryptophan synthase GliD1 [Cryphonectria parasitica EP155]|uniref:Dimethylallyl tryptophan synthase GliD1 n=1 Tax=Cryphonectria parasitica (strain ATCC 38755 / EP155) TaxID=660469 RepID=A0A9P4XSE9_CRYP1|nr:dimethylallyl tryptophan synthase GliD1 [Cryphonectria parasitica EP155]KAF3759925.1 dimethylallyl tryptophan synthase GliD1 [Cryphonectria parasitica EP155]
MTHQNVDSPSQVWDKLSKLLPTREVDSEFWWQLTGRHLAILVDAAGYSLERQYEALLFHYHWAVSHMGRKPSPSGELQYKSAITIEGSPIEYSWKWNKRSPTSQPDIRYSLEPIGPVSGTTQDPENRQAGTKLARRLAAAFQADLTWTDHFLSTLFDQGQHQRALELAEAGTPTGTTFAVAAEFVPSGLGFKTYCAPRAVTPPFLPHIELFTPSLRQLHPTSPARDALLDFLSSGPEGQALMPLMVAVDAVSSAKSRLKWYFMTPHTSFASARDIITLGGRRPNMDKTVEEVRTLIHAAVGLPAGFSDNEELPSAPRHDPASDKYAGEAPNSPPGLIYYFDIQPDKPLPEVKLYVPVWRYASDDLSVARRTVEWMKERGRGSYADRFLGMLERLADHRALSDGSGLQASVSCVCNEGDELDVTTYLTPEAKHAKRWANGSSN